MAERHIIQESGQLVTAEVYRATKIELGKMVSINATGFAIEGVLTQATHCLGVARETVDNSAGADGDLTVDVMTQRAFWFANSTVNAVDPADVGASCFVEDDETVRDWVGAGVNVRAGRVLALDATNGVQVYFDSAAGDVSAAGNLAVVGNLSAGGTLGSTGDATLGANLAVTGNVICVDVDPTGDISLDAGKAINCAPTGILVVPYDETTTGGAPTQAEMVAAFGAAADGKTGIMWDDTPGVAYYCFCEATTGWYYAAGTVGA